MSGYSIQTSLCPWHIDPWDGNGLPTARLVHYDDGSTIPVVNFAPEARFQLNLGALNNDEAVAYLRHLATQARELADAIEAHEAVAT